MSSDPTRPAPADLASQVNGTPDELRQEVERLREAIKQREEERDWYRKALERELAARLRAEFKPEDVVIPDPADCLTFDQFEHELEEVVSKGGRGPAK